MKKLVLTLILAVSNLLVWGAEFQHEATGFQLSYSDDIWRSMEVLEINKPLCVFEAEGRDNQQDFFNVNVFPSMDLPVDKTRLKYWSTEFENAFEPYNGKLKSSKIKRYQQTDWYFAELKLGTATILSCNTIQNGYSYNITMNISSPKVKVLALAFEQIMQTVNLKIPSAIESIKHDFEHPQYDSIQKIWIPTHFKLDYALNKKSMAPYAYSLYKSLLNQKQADFVLVANSVFDQLFCLNVNLNLKSFGNDANHLVSKVVGRKFTDEGIAYTEVSIAPWTKSPEKVYLHKFRLLKSNAATTHYIFSITHNNTTSMVKIQVATSMEAILEQSIEAYILKMIAQ